MHRLFLLSTLAAAGIGLAVAGCDQQDASDSSSVPMQQQGAMPLDSQNSTSPMTPQTADPQYGSEPEALQPDAAPADSNQ